MKKPTSPWVHQNIVRYNSCLQNPKKWWWTSLVWYTWCVMPLRGPRGSPVGQEDTAKACPMPPVRGEEGWECAFPRRSWLSGSPGAAPVDGSPWASWRSRWLVPHGTRSRIKLAWCCRVCECVCECVLDISVIVVLYFQSNFSFFVCIIRNICGLHISIQHKCEIPKTGTFWGCCFWVFFGTCVQFMHGYHNHCACSSSTSISFPYRFRAQSMLPWAPRRASLTTCRSAVRQRSVSSCWIRDAMQIDES